MLKVKGLAESRLLFLCVNNVISETVIVTIKQNAFPHNHFVYVVHIKEIQVA